jgi:hypothetical protein
MTNAEGTSSPSSDPKYPVFLHNVSNMTRYMRFFGIYAIVVGIIYCLGIVTAIIGIPVLKAGVRLRESATAFDAYVLSNSFDDLARAIEKQTRSFFIGYVLLIVGLVILVLYLILLVALIATGVLFG